MPSRRQFVGSVGASLLLAPFINMGLSRKAFAGSKQAKRLLVFCSMGTYPPLWTPTVSGSTITAWSAMTQPLSTVANNVVLVEGMPSGNPNDGHGSSDSLTGQGFGYYAVNNVPVIKISVDQFVAKNLVAQGINRPISSLLLGANTNENSGLSQFYGGSNGGNLPTIGSPLSAYNTVFGAALPTGMSASSLLTRRKSILDTITAEINGLEGTLGSNEKAKLDSHLASIQALENKLNASMPSGTTCTKPATPGADSTFQYMNDMDALAANLVHQQIIVNAFACDITRVACLEYGNDQKLMVNAPSSYALPYDDQHGGYIHSGAASNYANLVKFEAYLATQFASLVNALNVPDPLDATGATTMLDNTLMIWARDMGDAQNHNQQSMRFVLASGKNGYLSLANGGRYVKSTERHERILLNVCDAFGITNFTGFGDPALTGSSKTPLPGIAA
ncbi:MAG TPA: DUF1552 domain-containing protein [Polyangia bacterium]|nr:DUF1552 domain-containing protein [Polyangia bacterium]